MVIQLRLVKKVVDSILQTFQLQNKTCILFIELPLSLHRNIHFFAYFSAFTTKYDEYYSLGGATVSSSFIKWFYNKKSLVTRVISLGSLIWNIFPLITTSKGFNIIGNITNDKPAFVYRCSTHLILPGDL